MKNKDDKEQQEKTKMTAVAKDSRGAFNLVFSMLILLFVLVLFLLWYPLLDKTLTEYYKWALTTLMGAFGAWIGAGAAYFFGKENLQQSMASTERAMQIQQQSLQRPTRLDRLKDMTLTALNSNFMFNFISKKTEVQKKLEDFKGFWFVPVINSKSGVLEDVIHAQVFWNNAFKDDQITIQDMVEKMDSDKSLKKLHGEAFYVKFPASDRIVDVYDSLDKRGAEVVIVVDEKGKASHCLTKTELRSFLKAIDGG